MQKLNSILFKRIDNSALIVFRILFGVLIFLESIGAIFTGWVKRAFIEPEFTFTFIGLEFLQPLPGYGMYWYYAIMGVFGLCVAFGYYYRFSMGAFTLMWTITYWMQKSSYNNHYYLLILLCVFMLLVPAHRSRSMDVKQNRVSPAEDMPQWVSIAIIAQILIMYTYAAIAKIYPDWLELRAIESFLSAKAHYFLVGELLQQKAMHAFLAYGGLFFDLLVAIGLLYKPTRKIAFGCAIFFHLFNSFVFQVGIFPYLGLAFCLFFFEPEGIRKRFLKTKRAYISQEIVVPKAAKWYLAIGVLYFAWQILMPLRHWVIPGDVLYTEEGHRMSWRMMLRSKSSSLHYKLVYTDGSKETVYPRQHMSAKQAAVIGGRPDMIWQFAQRLKKMAASSGKGVKVYAYAQVNVNRTGWKQFIDPNVDLGSVAWSHWKHHEWVWDAKK
ncbi:MAG: HTTM domain-containing protein [Flavobacteriaceae bacterium]|nr:HTTM domain-containing protein [Flavobacteriaceae bacterium]